MSMIATINELALWETSADGTVTCRPQFSHSVDGFSFAVVLRGSAAPLEWSVSFDTLDAAMEAADAEMEHILWGRAIEA